jgi:tetratricopeptide (TPR) repeat protein
LASEKTRLAESVQKLLGKSDWKAAIAEMEKLFAVDPDPIVRVRIGDTRQKLGQKAEAVKEYIHAADLYADKGFVVKALAQYKLALRLDPANKQALEKIESLHANRTVSELKIEPLEEGTPQPTRSVIPLFADLTQDEFNEFTKRMIIQTVQPGKAIIREGEKGSSVYILTRGAVRVYANISGKRVDLADLRTSDFFGEIAFLTGQPRTATVEAVEESDVLEVAEADLNEMINRRPRIREVLRKYHEMRVKGTLEKVREAI